MKKITSLFLLTCGFIFAQQPQSFTEMTGPVQTGTNVETTVSSNNAENPLIGTYLTQGDFDTALAANCMDTTLIFEDFVGGPGGITTCGPIISSSDGGACFAVGELQDGFDIQASNATDVVFIPNGAIGNTSELVGANTFLEYTIINFAPEVYAVSIEIWANSDPNTDIRVFTTGGVMIGVVTITTTVGAQEFFGVISDEPIESIEIEGQNDSGELFGQFSFGADCSILGINDNALSQILLFPNPTTGIINIQAPNGLEIKSAVLYDVLGKAVTSPIVNNQINISQLSKGIYILNLETSEGILTKKIIKN
ncbi:MAG: T9SS type A sorting domain-containing protein [Bacteroidetes bacterium]|nr:MAG: T9SS type A sorting domain-containing protein [Bacteroidota bacterium]